MQTPIVSRTADTWTSTKQLASNSSYTNHAAVLLRDGKVLIAGGSGQSGESFTMTQLFDPSTTTWTQAGNLNTARPFDPTATLLVNGKVLLVGKPFSPGDKTAELYDPATNTWTKTTDMNFARAEQTTTLLSDGRVLVVGGMGDAGKTAELYNPADGTFTRTGGDPTVARSNHTATLLPSGKVLVAGGTGDTVGTTAELYNPADGTFTRTSGNLTVARASHTATLLPSGKVLVAGGEGSPNAGTTAELYDPIADTWTKLDQSLSPARVHHTATLLPSGRVLVAGGGAWGSETPTAVLYAPRSNGWAPARSMTVPRTNHTATRLQDGTVLVVGGSGATGQTSANNTAEFYVAFPFEDRALIALQADSGRYWACRILDTTALGGYQTDSAIEAAGSAINDPFNPAAKLIVRVLPNNQIALAIPGINQPGVQDNYLGRLHRVSYDGEFDAIEATGEATLDSIGSNCQFTVVILSNGRIALQADNTYYLYRSDRYGENLIEVLKTAIDTTCQCTVTYLG